MNKEKEEWADENINLFQADQQMYYLVTWSLRAYIEASAAACALQHVEH